MKKECKYGFIEWREPNLEEGLEIMEAFNSRREEKGLYIGIGKSLESIFPIFTKVDIKIGRKKYKTLEDLKKIGKVPFMTMLSELEQEIYYSMFDLEEEKKS
jgi:hypothetical protein